MPGDFADQNQRCSLLEVVGNKGVAKIVHRCVFNPRQVKIALNCGANVSYEEWLTGAGDKDAFWLATRSFSARGGSAFGGSEGWPFFKVGIKSALGSRV